LNSIGEAATSAARTEALFFPHLTDLRIEQAHVTDERIMLVVAATSHSAACPPLTSRSGRA
jgi:hypothetical protein